MNSANRATRSDIEKWLEHFFLKENVRNFRVNISGSSEKGDNYLGDITFVEITADTETGTRNYSFVIKCGKKSSQLRDIMPIRSVFENEIYFYTKVLPVFVEFQREKGVKDPFNNVPKCYDAFIMDDMEVLILENVKSGGFSLHDRCNSMNKEHIMEVVQTYGKFHAVSFALRDQKPQLFKSLSKELKDILKLMAESFKGREDTNVYKDIIALAREKNEPEIIEKAELLHKQSRKYNEMTDPSDPFAVILHGDCWNNNFMFKYKDNKKMQLSEVCLLDFQISRLASPVYDLSYFLFTCLSKDDTERFDDFVGAYYESLSNFLKELGSDPEKVFPFEELMNQWKRFAMFGLMMLPAIARICVSEKDEVSDLAEVAESDQDITETFTKTVKNRDKYAERTLPIMKLAIKKGFI